MTDIPKQLQIPEINFVLLEKGEKKPIEKEWTKKEISFDNPRLIEHLKNNGNYGVRGGGLKNLIIIDFDNEKVQNEICPLLPQTFTVKSGSGLLHKYFWCDYNKSFKIMGENYDTLVDIQGEGKQIVGPNSVHPNGNKYTILNDLEIAEITYHKLKELLDPYNKKPKKIKIEKELTKYENNDFLDKLKSTLTLSSVLADCGVDVSKNPTNCPLHTSKGGIPLGFNDEIWHCYHCENAGNMFSAITTFKNYNFNEALKYLSIKAGLEKEYKEQQKKYLEQNNLIKKQLIIPQDGKIISKFANEISEILKIKNELFYRPDSKEIVEVGKLKLQSTGEEIYTGFIKVTPSRFITLLEKYIIPGHITWSRIEGQIFKEKSISGEAAKILLESEILQHSLPQITRIFTIPIPIIYKNELTFPKKGYDERFNSWLPYDSPEISNQNMTLEEARHVISEIFKEFCFKSEQDKTNAIAGLLTPFLRGLFPTFNTRTPVYFYLANRERAGKDYLAGITGLLYENQALEEAPISNSETKGNNTEELRKKILGAFLNGRKRLHFSNNKGRIDNASFESIITATVWSDRMLGRNEIFCFENELDFSLSGNVGVTFTPDLANRCKFINLFLDIEDANSRKFNNPNLHQWIKENRSLILSALFVLIKNWINTGKKPGTLPFTSFSNWAIICGGIMESAGYNNPCVQDKEVLDVGGDRETTEMKRLFELCYELYPNKWITRDTIKKIIQDNDDLNFEYIDFTSKSEQIKFGYKLQKFVGRILSNIKLVLKDSKVRGIRQEFMFEKEVNIMQEIQEIL